MKKLNQLLICTMLLFASPSHAFVIDKFSLAKLGGGSVTLADYHGKVVLVNFWASWCPPCVHELPSMQALYEDLSEQPFEVLGLNMTEEPDTIEQFLQEFDTELTFPILLHADRSVANQWRVRGLPTTVIIDKSGARALTWQGPRDWNSDEVRELLQSLLDQ